MRVGISSRGNAWVSLGCLGWLFLGPFILAGYLVWIVAVLLMIAVRAAVQGGAWLIAQRHQRRARHAR